MAFGLRDQDIWEEGYEEGYQEVIKIHKLFVKGYSVEYISNNLKADKEFVENCFQIWKTDE